MHHLESLVSLDEVPAARLNCLYVYLVLSSPIISDVGEHAIMFLQV